MNPDRIARPVTTVSVPTRACLSGEDLDWLGGRSVCVALDLPTVATVGAAEPPGIARHRTDLNTHLAGVWRFLRDRFEWLPDEPAPVTVRTAAPPASGLSTSTSLIVSLFHGFAVHYGLPWARVAQWAYEYEFTTVRGGGMDQVAVVTGGAILTEGVEAGLPTISDCCEWPAAWTLVLLDSGIHKSTSTHIADVRRRLSENDPMLHQFVTMTDRVSESTWLAIQTADLARLHEELDRAHELMRDLQRMSSPALEAIRERAVKHTGVPFKLSGSGGGGALVGVFATEDDDRIASLRRHLQADRLRVLKVRAVPLTRSV